MNFDYNIFMNDLGASKYFAFVKIITHLNMLKGLKE